MKEPISLQRAKVALLLDHPFFATLLLSMETKVTDEIPTAAVDGQRLYINMSFFEKWTSDEQKGLLAHEVLHPAFLHHTRRNGRDPMIWNMACDYAINWILKEAGLRLPQGGLIDEKYKDMTVDAIYDQVFKEIKKKNGGTQGGKTVAWKPGDGFSGGAGDVLDAPQMTDSELQEHEQEIMQRLVAAHHVAKQQGKAPASISRMIDQMLEPQVDWRTALRQLVSEKVHDDYSWVKPNRRFMSVSKFYFPILENERFGEIVLAVDTSGSISQQDLNEYAAEVNDIHEILSNTVHVIYCDAAVAHVDHFDPDDPVEMNIHGGGGTDFRPPFKWVEKNDIEPKMLIYFTDGYCNSFPSPPEYDVIWCVNGGIDKFEPPFGTVIYLR